MAISERTLSEFLQHSGTVLPDLQEGEVVLHRRGGEDLVLLTRSQRDALQLTLRAFLHGSDVAAALPWFAFLPAPDQAACLAELRTVALGSLESGRLSRLVDALYGWRATALAVWDEQQSRARASEEEEEPLPLSRPR